MNSQRLEIGRRLRVSRLAAGLSQREVAAAAGLGYQTVHRLETAERGGHVETLLPLCDALGITLGDLVAGLPDVRDAAVRELWRRAA